MTRGLRTRRLGTGRPGRRGLTARTRGVTAVGVTAVLIMLLGGTNAQGDPSPRPAAAGTAASAAEAGAAAETAAARAELTGDITFSEPSGTFQGQLSVSLGTEIAGAEIRYRTDGQLPTADSELYQGSPVQLNATTQLRAQAFVGGTATGDPGTALYVARSDDASSDLPLLVMDAYGAGKPDREYFDVATMLIEPRAGNASLSTDPTWATRAGFRLRGQSSSMFEKAPYRLELWDNEDDDEDYPVLGMPAESDWVLRGPFSDKTLVHGA